MQTTDAEIKTSHIQQQQKPIDLAINAYLHTGAYLPLNGSTSLSHTIRSGERLLYCSVSIFTYSYEYIALFEAD